MQSLRCGLQAHWLEYLASLGAVVVVSLFIGLVLRQVSLANISMLSPIAVLTHG